MSHYFEPGFDSEGILKEMSVMSYPAKSEKQMQLDKECGCECHKPDHRTVNFMWCGYCHHKHIEDDRYPQELKESRQSD